MCFSLPSLTSDHPLPYFPRNTSARDAPVMSTYPNKASFNKFITLNQVHQQVFDGMQPPTEIAPNLTWAKATRPAMDMLDH